MPANRITLQWMPPAPGWVKINADVAFILDTGASWCGAVARDSHGLAFVSVYQELGISNLVEEADVRVVLAGLSELAKSV